MSHAVGIVEHEILQRAPFQRLQDYALERVFRMKNLLLPLDQLHRPGGAFQRADPAPHADRIVNPR